MVPLVRWVQVAIWPVAGSFFLSPFASPPGWLLPSLGRAGRPRLRAMTPSTGDTLSDLDGDGDLDMQTYTNESGQLWININRGADAGRLFFRVRAE